MQLQALDQIGRLTRLLAIAGFVVSGLVACKAVDSAVQPSACMPEELAQAKALLFDIAEGVRISSKAESFEAFERRTFKEPFEGGTYIVNGDTPIVSKVELRRFFEEEISRERYSTPNALAPQMLTVNQSDGGDAVWGENEKRNLSYCVSTAFGNRYQSVVSMMEQATMAWHGAADVRFVRKAIEDSSCSQYNHNVVFDVRPVDVNGQYFARAFFPGAPRSARSVLVDESAFELDPNGKLTLTGVLRHELGHTLGFRHEHTRPESGKCFEDADWRPVSDYDPFSVMHYPQCSGLGDWSLTLTALDRKGAACLYGAAPGQPAPIGCNERDTPQPAPSVCGPGS